MTLATAFNDPTTGRWVVQLPEGHPRLRSFDTDHRAALRAAASYNQQAAASDRSLDSLGNEMAADEARLFTDHSGELFRFQRGARRGYWVSYDGRQWVQCATASDVAEFLQGMVDLELDIAGKLDGLDTLRSPIIHFALPTETTLAAFVSASPRMIMDNITIDFSRAINSALNANRSREAVDQVARDLFSRPVAVTHGSTLHGINLQVSASMHPGEFLMVTDRTMLVSAETFRQMHRAVTSRDPRLVRILAAGGSEGNSRPEAPRQDEGRVARDPETGRWISEFRSQRTMHATREEALATLAETQARAQTRETSRPEVPRQSPPARALVSADAARRPRRTLRLPPADFTDNPDDCPECEGGGWVQVHSERPPAFGKCLVCLNVNGHPSP